jgi:hypothetical protein
MELEASRKRGRDMSPNDDPAPRGMSQARQNSTAALLGRPLAEVLDAGFGDLGKPFCQTYPNLTI